jgi:hypothetical protein
MLDLDERAMAASGSDSPKAEPAENGDRRWRCATGTASGYGWLKLKNNKVFKNQNSETGVRCFKKI